MRLAVKTAEPSEVLRPGTVYLAPPHLHLAVRPVGLTNGRRIHHHLSSADQLFASAAESLGGRVVAVVLTDGDRDGTDGVQAVRAGGGVLAQDEATSAFFDMPRSAIATGCVDRVLPLVEIVPALVELVTGHAVGPRGRVAVPKRPAVPTAGAGGR
jgi:two-component system chemotaxis response regulator CheB